MKVSVRPTSEFKLTIEGQELPGTFSLESEWEGFAKFVSYNPPRVVFAADFGSPGSTGERLSSLFNEWGRSKLGQVIQGVEGSLVQASKSITEQLKAQNTDAPAQP